MKMTSIQLSCTLTAFATRAQGSLDQSEVQLNVAPENVGADDIREAVPLLRAAKVRSVAQPASPYSGRATLLWESADPSLLSLLWEDANSEPWALIEQVMKHLLLYAVADRIAARV